MHSPAISIIFMTESLKWIPHSV